MNTLDSRWLRHGDTFIQRFARVGRYTYDFGRFPKERGRFLIQVKERSEKKRPQQHFVTVRQAKGGRVLDAVPRELSIEAGDVVLWSAENSAVPGYSIHGWGEGSDAFSSAAMTHEAVYSHAFGAPGVFDWRDPRNERIRGRVTVTVPQTEAPDAMEHFRELLGEGTVVLIKNHEVSPAEVTIIAGQTVFFAVEKGNGISITDTRLKR